MASSQSDHGAWPAKNRSSARGSPTVRRAGPAISASAIAACSTTTKLQHSVVLSTSAGVTRPVALIAVDTPSTVAMSSGRRSAVMTVARRDPLASTA